MFDHVIHYQFGFYGPGTHLDASPERIAQILTSLKDEGYIPTTITEVQLSPSLKTRAQLHFITPDEEWRLAFESKRVLLKWQSLPKKEMCEVDKFCKTVCTVFAKLLEVVPIVGNRLAFVEKGLFPEYSDEELARIRLRVLGDLPFYKQNLPIRWDTRRVGRIQRSFGGKTESLNVLTDINRVQGEFNDGDGGTRPFDRIEVELDVNTVQDNMAARFSQSDIEPFLEEAVLLQGQLIEEIGGALDE